MQGVCDRPSNLLACKINRSLHKHPLILSSSPCPPRALAGGIVSYTGSVGTEYTSDANVDFWQLRHGGDNQSIIRDADKVSAVEVGDILFMKGKLFPTAPNGLVHKAPEKRYHDDGSVINRLLLKVDVMPS